MQSNVIKLAIPFGFTDKIFGESRCDWAMVARRVGLTEVLMTAVMRWEPNPGSDWKDELAQLAEAAKVANIRITFIF